MRIVWIGDKKMAKGAIGQVNVDPRSLKYLVPKTLHFNMMIPDVNVRDASIIKQEMLSKGGDAAISKDCYNLKTKKSDVLITGSLSNFEELTKKLRVQPIKSVKNIGDEISEGIKNYLARKPRKTGIMGILNVTPDSFWDGNKYLHKDDAIRRAKDMEAEGADIIDVGGESTRPGHKPIVAKEERGRVIPVIKDLKREIEIPLSIDTTKPEIAKEALDLGVEIVNDQWGLQKEGRDNEAFAGLISDYGASVVLMYNKNNTVHKDLIREILDFLRNGIAIAENAGIENKNIIVDPGIGFGKSAEQDLEVLAKFEELRVLGKPIMVGASRKSIIGKTLGLGPPEERLGPSIAIAAYAASLGASLVRVHDVKETLRAVRMIDAILEARYG